MTDYKSIVGKGVKFVSSNLDNAQAEGQIWYNSTDGKYRDAILAEAWSSGGALITAKARYTTGGVGTQTAALAVGGYSTAIVTDTEEYNGSGWAVGGALGTGRYGTYTAGTQTAGLAATGKASPGVVTNVEEYNGSSWSEVNNNSAGRFLGSSCGTQTAALIYGGVTPPESNATEEYDGTNWTNGGNLNTARNTGFSFGTQTAGVIAGGGPGSGNTDATEHYDGSSWTTVNSMGTARRSGAASIASPQSSGLAFGGFTSDEVTTTEKYDGTTWTAGPAMGTGRYGLAGAGDSSGSALAFGGQDNSSNTFSVTEEFNTSVTVVTAAVFAAGGNANAARRQIGFTGNSPQDDIMGFGGFGPAGFYNNSETYNGTSWSEGNNLSEAKGQLAGAGESSTAALAFGGNGSNANTEEYNGTSWSEQNNLNTGRYELGGTGTQTAALAVAGESASSSTTTLTEEYDGTSWTASGVMNTARRENDAAGTQTAAITAGGGNPSAIANTETYNGSSWTSVNSLITASVSQRTMGGPTSQTAAVMNGGQAGSGGFVSTEQWDGTNFITGVNMNTGRFSHVAGGSISAGIVSLGDAPSPTMLNSTEEYTGETSAINVKNITTS